MSGIYIKGLNIKPCEDGFGGKGLVIIGYDDKIYAVAHEQIIPLPDHGDLIDRGELMKHEVYIPRDGGNLPVVYMSYVKAAKTVIPAERREDETNRR